jgi:hypothetical protein
MAPPLACNPILSTHCQLSCAAKRDCMCGIEGCAHVKIATLLVPLQPPPIERWGCTATVAQDQHTKHPSLPMKPCLHSVSAAVCDSGRGDAGCAPCLEGYFSPGGPSATCQACAPGSHNNGTGNAICPSEPQRVVAHIRFAYSDYCSIAPMEGTDQDAVCMKLPGAPSQGSRAYVLPSPCLPLAPRPLHTHLPCAQGAPATTLLFFIKPPCGTAR